MHTISGLGRAFRNALEASFSGRPTPAAPLDSGCDRARSRHQTRRSSTSNQAAMVRVVDAHIHLTKGGEYQESDLRTAIAGCARVHPISPPS